MVGVTQKKIFTYFLIFVVTFLVFFSINSKKQNELSKKRILDIHCDDVISVPFLENKNGFFVLTNFVPANAFFQCEESITLTMPSDFRFLDNIVPLVKRWKGPISLALYAPGDDFQVTVDAIAYWRNCHDPLINKFVTFHVFFENEHAPMQFDESNPFQFTDSYDCQMGSPTDGIAEQDMYKTKNELTFPINTARNIARTAAQTYFVFPVDIELYPSPNFIPQFMEYVKKHPEVMRERSVFVLPIFEVLGNETAPESKTSLQKMLKEKRAFYFHQFICPYCHMVPKAKEWVAAAETKEMDVFTTHKRQDKFKSWEPIYVCTRTEPLYDERFVWEGGCDKMSNGYALCLMDYDFKILNNAFLTHRPGVKKVSVQETKYKKYSQKTRKLLPIVTKEMQKKYGNNPKCHIYG